MAEALELTGHLRRLRAAKEAAVRRSPGTDSALPPRVVLIRGGAPVAEVDVVQDERDHLAHAVSFAPRIFLADEVLLAFEAWHTVGREDDPRTGKAWAFGAMGSYVAEHGLDGTVVESLNVYLITRTRVVATVLTFRVEGGAVVWGEEIEPDDDPRHDGRLFTIAREALAFETADVRAAYAAAASLYNPGQGEQALVRQDRAACMAIEARLDAWARPVASPLQAVRSRLIAEYAAEDAAAGRGRR